MTKNETLKEEFIKYWQARYEIHPSELSDLADWWLSKISQKELEDLKEIPQFKGTLEQLDNLL